MLSFDISDRQINIVKGDNSSNKIRIERSLQVDIPEDMILNGESSTFQVCLSYCSLRSRLRI